MASFDDDFEAYSVGAHPPFGGWTSPFVNPNLVTIVAGGATAAGTPSTKAVRIVGGSVCKDFGSLTFFASSSVFCHFFPTQDIINAGGPIDIFDLVNGPTPTFAAFPSLMTVRIENDTTISIYSGNTNFGSQFLCNSGDFNVKLQSWNWLQVEASFGIGTVSGTDFLKITVHVVLDGVEICSASNFVTSIQIADLLGIHTPNDDPKYNIVRFLSNEIIVDNVTWNSANQTLLTYPHEGTPVMKATGAVAEFPLLPDEAKIQGIEGVGEFALLPDSAKLNGFQGVVELILLPTITPGLWKVKEY